MSLEEVPEPDCYELILVCCPDRDCDWSVDAGWDDPDEDVNRHPAYVEHYTQQHLTRPGAP